MHHNKFNFFLCLRGRQTHFMHAQGHQRPGAFLGSINVIRNIRSAVKCVERRKTVDKKMGKPTYWFSEVIKKLLHHKFRER